MVRTIIYSGRPICYMTQKWLYFTQTFKLCKKCSKSWHLPINPLLHLGQLWKTPSSLSASVQLLYIISLIWTNFNQNIGKILSYSFKKFFICQGPLGSNGINIESPGYWNMYCYNLNLRSTFPTDKMALATLEHLIASFKLFETNLEIFLLTLEN